MAGTAMPQTVRLSRDSTNLRDSFAHLIAAKLSQNNLICKSVFENADDFVVREFVTPLEEFQFNEKSQSDYGATHLLDNVCYRPGRAPRGDQVIDNDDALSWLDGIPMNLQAVRPVFQLVCRSMRRGRQFSRFPHRNESRF